MTGDFRHVHDPTLTREGEWYYLVATGNGIPLRRSRDLRHWEYVREIFPEIPAWAKDAVPGVRSLWAPELVRVGKLWRLYYSISTFGSNRSAIALATSPTLDPSRPDYAWTDHGPVIQTQRSDNWNAIDPCVTPDGRWFAAGSFWSGIYQMELDPKTGKRRSETAPLAHLAHRPENPHALEAPYLFRRKGFWYLLVSFDFCCRGVKSTYHLRVGRAKDPTGPFVDRDGKPLTDGGGTLVLASSAMLPGPGHGMVFSEKGTDWLVHHFYDPAENGVATLAIRPLSWTREGWPEASAPSL